ncbi:sigma-70 family RNA polymerase sigma factor [Ottowia thiooxydans]|uniref:RNA polymerase sigma factor (Sigma-70 family) n=1 Tax=Ottowia thiooxydans TaxID=219182 RepID=A0ABV2QGL7_9BURK
MADTLMLSGDTTLSIHALYCNHHRWLQSWLNRRLGNAFDAADLAQDTFVRILVSGRTPEAEQSRAHLTKIAKGLVIDLHRRRVLEAAYLQALAHLPSAVSLSEEERALVLEDLLRVDAALHALTPKAREAFLLSQLDGLTYSEIAQRMGVSFGSVRKYMLRAAQALQSIDWT